MAEYNFNIGGSGAKIQTRQRPPPGFFTCSGEQTKTICCQCRNGICRNGAHSDRTFRVGWKFEYPKKRHVKEWAKLEAALREKDFSHPMVERSPAIDPDTPDSFLFPWAEIYRETVTREKRPRHKVVFLKYKFTV